MKFSRITLAGLLLLGLGCGEPMMMLPGGALSGTLEPPPSDWKFSDVTKVVQLETRPDDPYSVNIWGVAVGHRFLIGSGSGMENAWARHIDEDPNVRLRVGTSLYELRAVMSKDPTDRERFLEAVTKKYDEFDPEEERSSESVIYQLEPRRS